MRRFADYSAGRPSGNQIKAAGFSGTNRYIALGSSGKLLTAQEYANQRAAGLEVHGVVERNTTDAWGGYSAGVANAQAGLKAAKDMGLPKGFKIAGAADAHASNQAQINAAVQYARGFHDVLGKDVAGFYGFMEVLRAVYQAGWCSWHWLCGSEPSAADKLWVNHWQRNKAPTIQIVGGVVFDINEEYNVITTGGGGSSPGTATQGIADMLERKLPKAKGPSEDPELNDPGFQMIPVPIRDGAKVVLYPGWGVDPDDITEENPNPPSGPQPLWVTAIWNFGANHGPIDPQPVVPEGTAWKIDGDFVYSPPSGTVRTEITYSTHGVDAFMVSY